MWFLVLVLIILIILLVFYYISFIKALYFTKSPYVGTFNKELKILKKLNIVKWKTLIDLWCGDWKVLRFFEKEFWIKWVWYDVNSFAILWWKILNKFLKTNIRLIQWNFFDNDISNYDYIYIYLMPSVMKDVEKFVFKNKKTEAIVIVNSFPFPNKKPFKVIGSKIYLYR